MSEPGFRLANAPIVEAIFDFDCQFAPGANIASLKAIGTERFRDAYPTVKVRGVDEHVFSGEGVDISKQETRRVIQAFLFEQSEGKQIVQIRVGGFSFNRLSPYTSFSELLPELERTWNIYAEIARPVLVQKIRMRFINRILLPMDGEVLKLDDYIKGGPTLPSSDELSDEDLQLTGFLDQYSAIESKTKNEITVISTAQDIQSGKLPVILDISVAKKHSIEPSDWSKIGEILLDLRRLKNSIFKSNLTSKCLNLFSDSASADI